MHAYGTIVILNGPSCSGKSTIQRAVQKRADFLRVGIDCLFDELIEEPDISQPTFDQYTHEGEYIRGVSTKLENGKPVVSLKIGSAGDRIIRGMHRALAAYAQSGNNLIVDYILYKADWLPDLQESLREYRVIWVKVNAPLEVLEQREKRRANSPVGHARSHFKNVHGDICYDLELDTSRLSPEQCAAAILRIQSNS